MVERTRVCRLPSCSEAVRLRRRLYCSPGHARLGRCVRETRTCASPSCGKSFDTTPSSVKRCCTPSCVVDLRRHEATGYTRNGYVHIYVDGRQVRRCRAVMEQVLGRPLAAGENVHHRNGVRDDDRPENLELWVTSQPAGQRAGDLIEWHRAELERLLALPASVR